MVSENSDDGKVWNNSTKMYDGVVDIYYNPTPKNLITEDLNINGGYVKLKGTVVSTGGADITIDTTNTNNDLRIGKINNYNRQGVVIIEDTSKGETQTFTISSYYQSDNYAFGWTGGVNYRQALSCEIYASGNFWDSMYEAAKALVASGFKESAAERAVMQVLDIYESQGLISKTPACSPTSLKDLKQGAFFKKFDDGDYWDDIENYEMSYSNSTTGPTNIQTSTPISDYDIHANAIFNATIDIWRIWNQTEDYTLTTNYYVLANKNIDIVIAQPTNGGKIDISSSGNISVDHDIFNGGSIVNFTAKKGDLIIEKVESKDGDVSIYTENGSILDGTDQTYELSDSTKKLQTWIDAGLISEDDTDDSSTNAAKTKKSAVINSKEISTAASHIKFADKNYSTSTSDNFTYDTKTSPYRTAYLEEVAAYLNNTADDKKLAADGHPLTADEMALISDYAWANASSPQMNFIKRT